MNQSELQAKLDAEIADINDRLNDLKSKYGTNLFDCAQYPALLYSIVFYSEQLTWLVDLNRFVTKGGDDRGILKGDYEGCVQRLSSIIYHDKHISGNYYERADAETRLTAKIDLLNTLWRWHRESTNA